MIRIPVCLFLFTWMVLPTFAQVWPEERFHVSYYANPTLSGEPATTGIEPTVNRNWSMGSPGAILPADGFSVRWRGSFTFGEGTWRFLVRADEGVRLWIDSRLVINAWPNTATEQSALVHLSEGPHRIEVAYFEGTGNAFIDLSWAAYAPTTVCNSPEASWCAEYYPNLTLSGTAIQRSETSSGHRLNISAPAGAPTSGFSARFQGSFPFEEGFYRFQCNTRDGIRIWVDDTLLLESWANQSTTTHEAVRFISEGTHQIRVEHYRTTNQDSLLLVWDLNQTAPYDGNDSPLGTNITALDYYSSEWTLLNAFKSSGGWYTQTTTVWDTLEQAKLDLDEHGWVRSLPSANDPNTTYRSVAALLLNGTGGHYPGGRYLVLYDGEGTLTYGNDAVYVAAQSSPGRHVLNVTPQNGGILIRLTATNPANYVRNIRVVLDSSVCSNHPYSVCTGVCEGTSCQAIEDLVAQKPFHPTFLRDLQGYRVIRYMDFMHTNSSTLVDWEDRPRLEDARWSGEFGVPLELIIQLANQTHTDAWINVPTRANDDFVVQMAELFRDTLKPGLKVYVEYSNEIWNTAFPNGNWVEQQAVARWPQSSESSYLKRLNYAGMRSAQVVDLFKEVFAEQQNRVIGVMGGFAANDWFSEQILTCPIAVAAGEPPCYQNMSALAIAPYFGAFVGQPRLESVLATWLALPDRGLDNLFQELATGGLLHDPQNPNWAHINGGLAQAREFTAINSAIASRYGLELFAYEGGQHLVGVGNQMNNNALTELFVAANRDPRMRALYKSYLADWREEGGSLFCHFLSVQGFGRFGSWGAKEHQDETDAPKFIALNEFLSENPCWWDGCTRPESALQPYIPIPFGF